MNDQAQALLESLSASLGADAVLRERSDLAAFEEGWRYGKGLALAAVRPRSPQEVSEVLRASADAGVRVHATGANTGLVGASNPDATGEQLVLSMERLNKNIEIDPVGRTVIVDAGVTLSQLNEALEPHGLFFPIDLGADPQIGGMVVTNTGGSRLLRYGDVRRHLLGVEVALASGTLVDGLSALRKDNTGLDWKHLFVGTSGSFGIVTRVSLSVETKPKQQAAMMVAADSGDALLKLLAHLERAAGEVTSAFEVISKEALELTLAHGSGIRCPFEDGVPRYSALVELSSSFLPGRLDLAALLEESLGEFFEATGGEGLVDAVSGRPEEFWGIRHQVSESLAHERNLIDGQILALDLSVPRSKLPQFSEAVRSLLSERAPFVRVCDFGHWGDGGTHLNLLWRRGDAKSEGLGRELQREIYDLCVLEYAGSFSAEHGVGPHNQEDADRYASSFEAQLQSALRAHLDPQRRLERKGERPKSQ